MDLETTAGIRHHTREQCDGEPCPFHGPSLHPMIEEPMLLRETGLIERTCRHGVGHPDPDSAAFMDRALGHRPGTWSVHGCDGCCSLTRPDRVVSPVDASSSSRRSSRQTRA